MNDFRYQYLSNCNNPEKWIIFLHGYNNTIDEMSHVFNSLLDKTSRLGIIVPIGKHTSSTDINRHSWWKISGFDAKGKRLDPQTDITEIANIYNQAGNIAFATASELNVFIDKLQQQYNFSDAQTSIVGFSQGAMLSLWTALSRTKKINACFSLSGLVIAANLLKNNIKTHPNIYLMHGKKDKQVQHKCLEYSVQTLKDFGLKPVAITYENLGHEVITEQTDFIASVLK